MLKEGKEWRRNYVYDRRPVQRKGELGEGGQKMRAVRVRRGGVGCFRGDSVCQMTNYQRNEPSPWGWTAGGGGEFLNGQWRAFFERNQLEEKLERGSKKGLAMSISETAGQRLL